MDVNTKIKKDEYIKQLQEDSQSEWWRAGEIDDFNLKNKLARVGCRPLKRNYMGNCHGADPDYSAESYGACQKLRQEMDECYKALHFMEIEKMQSKLLQKE